MTTSKATGFSLKKPRGGFAGFRSAGAACFLGFLPKDALSGAGLETGSFICCPD
jgi:hypothetical protein